MASSEEETTRSIEPAKAVMGAKNDQDVKEPLLPKAPPVSAASALKLTYGGLPAFRLPPEGLGGKKLAAAWVT